MDPRTLLANADDCRQKAIHYLGRPEARLLLAAADEFQRLAYGSEGLREPSEDKSH
jgi:hypothetical protein